MDMPVNQILSNMDVLRYHKHTTTSAYCGAANHKLAEG